MPRCSVYIAVSLDGYIARPDGGLDWLGAVQVDGEDYGYAAFSETIDTLVMGRGTWDVARAFPEWPYGGKRVIVLTHRPEIARNGEEFWSGDVGDLVAGLSGRVYVDGGVVIRQLLAAGLVDDLTLSIVPVILGEGIRLFDRGLPEVPLRLLAHRAFPSGLVQLTYSLR